MSLNIIEKALILHIRNNLNEQYDMKIKLVGHRIHLFEEEGKGRELGSEEVRTELNLRYEQLKSHGNKD